VGTFSAILVLLGGGLLLVLQRQFTEQLDGSLRESLSPIMRYVQSQPSDAELRAAVNAGAIDALHSLHREVFIFTADGVPIGTAVPAPWIQSAALVAASAGVAVNELDAPGDHTLRLRAERFALVSGTSYVAVMLVDRDRIDDRFEALFAAFGGRDPHRHWRVRARQEITRTGGDYAALDAAIHGGCCARVADTDYRDQKSR